MPSTQLAVFNHPESATAQNITLNPAPNPTTTVGTIAGWINLNRIPSGENHLVSAGAGRGWWGFGFTSTAQLTFRATNWSAGGYSTTTTLTPGTWYHVAVTQDGTYLRFYINGQLNQTFTTNRWWSTYGPHDNLYILAGVGYNSPYASMTGRPLDARAQNVQLWDVKLEDSEINTLYNNGQPLPSTDTQPQTNNLVYHFFPTVQNWNIQTQDPAGTATYNRRISYDARASLSTTECLSLTASTISTGDPQGFTLDSNTVSGSLTLSCWVNWAISGSNGARFFRLTNTSNENVYFNWYTQNSTRVFQYRINNASIASVSGNGVNKWGAPTGTWQNIIIHIPNASSSFNTNQIRLWVNGKEATIWTTDSVQTPIQSIQGCSVVGSMSLSNWAAFENLTINDANIKAIAGAEPSDISSLNPKVWYKLNSEDISFATSGNKATAMTITDSSGNGLNASGAYDYDE